MYIVLLSTTEELTRTYHRWARDPVFSLNAGAPVGLALIANLNASTRTSCYGIHGTTYSIEWESTHGFGCWLGKATRLRLLVVGMSICIIM